MTTTNTHETDEISTLTVDDLLDASDFDWAVFDRLTQEEKPVYFPPNVFNHITAYCDDRIERKQKALWESIKVDHLILWEDGVGDLLNDDDDYFDDEDPPTEHCFTFIWVDRKEGIHWLQSDIHGQLGHLAPLELIVDQPKESRDSLLQHIEFLGDSNKPKLVRDVDSRQSYNGLMDYFIMDGLCFDLCY